MNRKSFLKSIPSIFIGGFFALLPSNNKEAEASSIDMEKLESWKAELNFSKKEEVIPVTTEPIPVVLGDKHIKEIERRRIKLSREGRI